ncbi:hypothetical protein HNQ80_004323 [Anaerosolibacter carboniphilus]|uniref:Terminase n=1 Tax=Anaerosolibacter carboniphilus TaxID=1417629 RepID=A0A841KXW3_9FIRM|nr:phage tail tube protein [Anaerosolibacter carboniphilus]MBB6218183.1 hypothetical protein [Anaerosolibacter carboniphilus]
MAKLKANRVINGTFGSIWVNSEKWAEVKSFELKVQGQYEDVNFCEELGKHRKYMGFEGTGTMTLQKVYDRGAKLLAEAFKSGEMPDVKIVGKLADPAAFGHTRVEVTEVTFDEFTLLKFENKALGEEELPFQFADYDLIDAI